MDLVARCVVTIQSRAPIHHQSATTNAPALSPLGSPAGASFFLYKTIDKDRLLKLVRATQGALESERRAHAGVPLQTKVRLKKLVRRNGTSKLWT